MKKLKFKLNIDWKSKLLDLLIVIIGITIAFKLNNWNESRKINNEEKSYQTSFYDENTTNQQNLEAALEFSQQARTAIDSLKSLLLSSRYSDPRIPELIGSMMAMANFSPITTTMENITASGEFDLITDIELRTGLISTYNAYKTSSKFENLLVDYVDQYLTPYLMEHIRFRDFSPINADYVSDPLFENIVLGYEALLFQKINGYEKNLAKLNQLQDQLAVVVR